MTLVADIAKEKSSSLESFTALTILETDHSTQALFYRSQAATHSRIRWAVMFSYNDLKNENDETLRITSIRPATIAFVLPIRSRKTFCLQILFQPLNRPSPSDNSSRFSRYKYHPSAPLATWDPIYLQVGQRKGNPKD